MKLHDIFSEGRLFQAKRVWINSLCLALSVCAAPLVAAQTQDRRFDQYPAHYIVFEVDAAGVPQPVFYRQVQLAGFEESDLAPQPAAPTEQRFLYSAKKNGRLIADRYVDVERFIRAEFPRDLDDAERSLASPLEGQRVLNTRAAFVLRLPQSTVDEISFSVAGRTHTTDLQSLAARARSLPLADQPMAQVVNQQRSGTGNPANRVDVLLMGDGYTTAQQSNFTSASQQLYSGFFALTPYKEYETMVNWADGFVASNQSGADHPPYLAGCTASTCCADSLMQSDPLAGQLVDTAFDAKYCTSNIHRLLTVNASKVFAAASSFPNWDQIFMVVNDSTYGGAGGSFAVYSRHASANQIAFHEYGHSFTDLADEYDSAYPGFPACSDLSGSLLCEANVTNQTNAALVKWNYWFTPGNPIPTPAGTSGVGLFQGARYLTTGMYRPVHNCMMRALNQPFCAVCREAYIEKIYRGGFGVPGAGVRMIEPNSAIPTPTSQVIHALGSTTRFSVTTVRPLGSTAAQWFVNGSPVSGANLEFYDFTWPVATSTPVSVRFEIRDQLGLVRPSSTSTIQTQNWTVLVTDLFGNGFE